MSINHEVKDFHKLLGFSLSLLDSYLKNRIADYTTHEKEMDDRNKHIVYMENMALLETELSHIEKTVKFIMKMDLSKYKSAVELKDSLLEQIKKYYHDNGIPNVCTIIMTDKINKSYEFYNQLSVDS